VKKLPLNKYNTVKWSPDSAFGIRTNLDAGRSRVRILVWGKRFVSTPNRPERLYGTPSLLFNRYQGSFLEVKWPKRDDHSPTPSAEVKNEWSHTSSSPTFVHGVCVCVSTVSLASQALFLTSKTSRTGSSTPMSSNPSIKHGRKIFKIS
jgi:hypothetical protein